MSQENQYEILSSTMGPPVQLMYQQIKLAKSIQIFLQHKNVKTAIQLKSELHANGNTTYVIF